MVPLTSDTSSVVQTLFVVGYVGVHIVVGCVNIHTPRQRQLAATVVGVGHRIVVQRLVDRTAIDKRDAAIVRVGQLVVVEHGGVSASKHNPRTLLDR